MGLLARKAAVLDGLWGRKMHGELGEEWSRFEGRLLAGFSPQEAAALRDLLHRVAVNLGEASDG